MGTVQYRLQQALMTLSQHCQHRLEQNRLFTFVGTVRLDARAAGLMFKSEMEGSLSGIHLGP